MKKYYLLPPLFFLLFSCAENGEIKNVNDPEEVTIKVPNIYVESDLELISKKLNGDIYIDGKPFSGYLIFRHINNSISIKKGYVEGRLNGVSTAFYPDGSVRYTRPYFDGEKHGIHVGFHSNGEKKFQYYFENGFNEGNHLEWYDNAQKASDMNYVKGKEFGRQQAWRPDGKLRANYIVRENGRMYGLQGIKRCTKLDGETKTIDPYKGVDE